MVDPLNIEKVTRAFKFGKYKKICKYVKDFKYIHKATKKEFQMNYLQVQKEPD